MEHYTALEEGGRAGPSRQLTQTHQEEITRHWPLPATTPHWRTGDHTSEGLGRGVYAEQEFQNLVSQDEWLKK